MPVELWGLSHLSKGSRTFPGGSYGNCPLWPPSSETLLSHTAQGVLLYQHNPESSLQTWKPHPHSGLGFICVFLLDYFYLLDIKVEVYSALFIIKDKVTQISSEWPVLSNLLCASGGNVHSSPFSWKLRVKFLLEICIFVLFISFSITLMSSPSLVLTSTHYLTTEQSRVYKIVKQKKMKSKKGRNEDISEIA